MITIMNPKSFAFPIDNQTRGIRLVLGKKWLVILLLSQICFGQTLDADEIVFRNLKVISDVNIESFDPDGISLSNGKQLTLDTILSAKLKQQQEFDKILDQVGNPLFRIRLRLKNQDFENLQTQLEQVYSIYANRKSLTASLVHIAKFHESLLLGKWEIAALSHFKLVTLANANQENASYIDSLGYQFDRATGLSDLINPFDFKKESLVENWDSIVAAYRNLPENRPSGLDFYFFCLAKAANRKVAPELVSNRLKTSFLENLFLDTLPLATGHETNASQIEVARGKLLEIQLDAKTSNLYRALFYYVSGQLELKSEQGDPNEGLLNLLRIHAEYGQMLPTLSAAALKSAYDVLNRKVLSGKELPKNAKSIASELLSRYPSSIYAKPLRIKATK
ncbi:MAG: hypothetical protein VX438_19655 [Planctomycetota bacterium]|nr:hypothetical protein [Planctomycetota bacterium]